MKSRIIDNERLAVLRDDRVGSTVKPLVAHGPIALGGYPGLSMGYGRLCVMSPERPFLVQNDNLVPQKMGD